MNDTNPSKYVILHLFTGEWFSVYSLWMVKLTQTAEPTNTPQTELLKRKFILCLFWKQ